MTIAYVNNLYKLLQDLQALLNTELSDYTVLIGDRPAVKQPTIIIEPTNKTPHAGAAFGKKMPEYEISLWLYRVHSNNEEALKLLSETVEDIEQLLINNVKYPVNDGSSWLQVIIQKVEYGFVYRGGNYLRVHRMTLLFKQMLNR